MPGLFFFFHLLLFDWLAWFGLCILFVCFLLFSLGLSVTCSLYVSLCVSLHLYAFPSHLSPLYTSFTFLLLQLFSCFPFPFSYFSFFSSPHCWIPVSAPPRSYCLPALCIPVARLQILELLLASGSTLPHAFTSLTVLIFPLSTRSWSSSQILQ